MNFDIMLEPLRVFAQDAGAFVPRLGLALLVLIAGWLLAKAALFAVARGLRAVNFNVLTERAGLDGFLRQGGIESDTTAILGQLVYWLVILAALVIAFNSLGLTYVTDILGKVVLFVPKVIVALLILAFGGYFARFVAGAIQAYCANVGVQDGELLGRIAQYTLITFVVLIALDQLSIGGDIVRQSFLIILAGVVFGLALAFGIGGQARAAEMLERWWPKERQDNKP